MRRVILVVAVVACFLIVSVAGLGIADEVSPAGVPPVELDKLMKPPDAYIDSPPNRQAKRGSDEQEWRYRFVAAEHSLLQAKQDLAYARTHQKGEAVLEKKKAVEEAKRARRRLAAEADLAAVPEGWRHRKNNRSKDFGFLKSFGRYILCQVARAVSGPDGCRY